MLIIRLSRIGKRKQPSYRLIISEKRQDPWGKYLELLGHYNPRTKEVNLRAERIKHWLAVGAQTSNTVHNLLVKQGLIEAKKRKSVRITKRRKAKKEKSQESKPSPVTETPASKETVESKPANQEPKKEKFQEPSPEKSEKPEEKKDEPKDEKKEEL